MVEGYTSLDDAIDSEEQRKTEDGNKRNQQYLPMAQEIINYYGSLLRKIFPYKIDKFFDREVEDYINSLPESDIKPEQFTTRGWRRTVIWHDIVAGFTWISFTLLAEAAIYSSYFFGQNKEDLNITAVILPPILSMPLAYVISKTRDHIIMNRRLGRLWETVMGHYRKTMDEPKQQNLNS